MPIPYGLFALSVGTLAVRKPFPVICSHPGPTDFSQFRPFTLCTFISKVFTVAGQTQTITSVSLFLYSRSVLIRRPGKYSL